MAKRQKKWNSEAEILKAIDSAHRKLERMRKAAQLQLDCEELYRGCDATESRNAKEMADQLLGKIKRLQETRLPKLGQLLSEFRTIPLGEINGVEGLKENQVVLQNKANA